MGLIQILEEQSFFPPGVDAKLFPVNKKRYEVLGRLVRSLPLTRLRVLEVGSFIGQSAVMWSERIAQHSEHGGQVVCVDPWKPFLSEEDVATSGLLYQQTQRALEDGSAFEQFKKNRSLAAATVPINFIRTTLSEMVDSSVVWAEPFDIVYIDGSHYYPDVKKDLSLAKCAVKIGGILCGDDLEVQFDTVNQEECRRVAEKQRDFIGYHPGVTLAVWETFGRVWADHGAWAMQQESGSVWKFPTGV